MFDKGMVLENINREIKKGENWVLLGSSGAGGATFVRLARRFTKER